VPEVRKLTERFGVIEKSMRSGGLNLAQRSQPFRCSMSRLALGSGAPGQVLWHAMRASTANPDYVKFFKVFSK
jgi:hypothetical protein